MSYSNLGPGQVVKKIFDENNNAIQVKGVGGALVTEAFDYIAASFPDSVTEQYVYKIGGSSGTTVATITVVYTDSSKSQLDSVTKS